MKKLLVVILIMLFITPNYGSVALAKEKKANTKVRSATTKEKIDNSPLVPFDINAAKLLPNFKGTDIIKLYTALLNKAPLKKQEFETTADYEKKISAAITDDVYAFKLPSDIGSVHGLTIQPYNADTQKFQIDIETTYLSQYTFQDYRASIIIKDINGPSRSYIGSNAFGATVLVNSYSGTQYGIALVNQKDFGTSLYDDNRYNIKTPLESIRTINLSLDMPPEKAKTLKNNIGVLILCKPTLFKSTADFTRQGNDLIFEDTYYKRATIDSPTTLSYERKFVNVEVLSIWVYEINTGAILLKQQLKNKENQQST